MVKGNIVTFKNEPTVNTPGVCEDALIFGIEFTGVVIKARPIHLHGGGWCDVLWSGNQVTRCYQEDLKVWN